MSETREPSTVEGPLTLQMTFGDWGPDRYRILDGSGKLFIGGILVADVMDPERYEQLIELANRGLEAVDTQTQAD